MENTEIDYGNGVTNIDTETGIRYGVISTNNVGQSWWEYSEEGLIYACPYCGEEIEDFFDKAKVSLSYDEGEVTCKNCDNVSFEDEWLQSDGTFVIDNGTYKAFRDSDNTDIFITKSPYYTLCSPCSPCAPGAGDIMSQKEYGGVKAYCFGHEWYESGEAPYKVYEVKTGKEVKV